MTRLLERTRSRISGPQSRDGSLYLYLERAGGAVRPPEALAALCEAALPGIVYENPLLPVLDEAGRPLVLTETVDGPGGLPVERPILDERGRPIPLEEPDPATERLDGVSVTAQEAVIALARPVSDGERRTLLAALDATPREDVPPEPEPPRPVRGGAGGGMHLVTVIELWDKGAQVTPFQSPRTFDTRSPLDTADFDGATFYFEIVASVGGTDVSAASLLDSSDTEVASVAIPDNGINVADVTRARSTAFTPTSGADNYRVKIEGAGTNHITATRIIIVQEAATKTQTSWSLLSSLDDGVAQGADQLIWSNGNTSYTTSNTNSVIIELDKTKLDNIIAGSTAWEFNVMLWRLSATSAQASLFNKTDNAQIASSEVSTTSTTPVLLTATFADSETSLDSGDQFEMRTKVTGSGSARTSHADLRVRLDSLAKSVTNYRFARGNTFGASVDVERWLQRILYDGTQFDQVDAVEHHCTASEVFADNSTIEVSDDNGNDDGVGGVDVASSAVTVNGGRAFYKTGSLTLDDGDRFIAHMTEVSGLGSLIVVQSWLNVESTAVAGGRRRVALVF